MALGLGLACNESKPNVNGGATSGDVTSGASHVNEAGSQESATAESAERGVSAATGETNDVGSRHDSSHVSSPNASSSVSEGTSPQGSVGSDDVHSTSPTGPTVTVSAPENPDDFWRMWAEVVCVYRERCNGFPETKSCREHILAKVRSERRFASPIVTLDLGAGLACLQVYAGPSCPPDSDLHNLGLGEQCARFSSGTVAVDGACRHDAECVDGAYCNTDDACPGVCRPVAELEQSCSDTRCAFGLSCGTGDICVRDLDVGSACSGEATEHVSCRLNTRCHEGRCMTTLPYTRETGESCWTEDHCKSGARCVSGGCEPLAELGQSCDGRACAPGLFCDEVMGSCQSKKETGTACSQETECSDGPCSGGSCLTLGGVGDSCSRNQLCHSGSCVNQRCELSQACTE